MSNEISSTGGWAVENFAMNLILLFMVWALVVAIPCQGRGLQTHFAIPCEFGKGQSIVAFHERVLVESKKMERRNICGLLKELGKIEKPCLHHTEKYILSDRVYEYIGEKPLDRNVKDQANDICSDSSKGSEDSSLNLRKQQSSSNSRLRRSLSFSSPLNYIGPEEHDPICSSGLRRSPATCSNVLN